MFAQLLGHTLTQGAKDGKWDIIYRKSLWGAIKSPQNSKQMHIVPKDKQKVELTDKKSGKKIVDLIRP